MRNVFLAALTALALPSWSSTAQNTGYLQD
jgi:hypothetical protein